MSTSPPLLTGITFDEARRGYDRLQVDTFLLDLGTKIEQLQDLWHRAHQHAAEAERRLAELGADERTAPADTDRPVQPDQAARPDAGERPVIDLTAAPPPAPATKDLLTRIPFAVVRRGYDRVEVDYFLREAGVKIAELQDMYQQARRRAARAEELITELDPTAATPASPPPAPSTAVSSTDD